MDIDNNREQLLNDRSIGKTVSSYVKFKLRKADEEKSNGETTFRYFVGLSKR